MNRTRWAHLTELVIDSLELDRADREPFLDSACRTKDGALDSDLKKEAEALIRAAEAADAVNAFTSPLASVAARAAEAESLQPDTTPDRIGPWRPTARLGAGGMGVVYAAERAEKSFKQTAALKLVLPAFAVDFRERFIRERAVLASLDHPGVARLLDGGISDDGTPYLAMELVRGESITRFCEQRQLGVQDRLRLFLTGCEAVAYAHTNLVVHRDLKPAHMLVDEREDPPRVKLLDFGVAKLLSDDVGMTRTGPGPLTPAYAAPEQLLGAKVTTATDVYSLGVILYELLAETPPYDLGSLTASQKEKLVCEVIPPRPSDAVHSTRTSRAITGDLDQIVLKALAKEPERRYSGAGELADDIRNHLAGLPVSARRDTAVYRITKFVRRYRIAVGFSVLALLTITTMGAVFAIRLARERDHARQAAVEATVQAQRTQAVASFLERILRAPNSSWYVRAENKGPDTPIRDVLDDAASRIPIDFADQPDLQADLHHIVGDTYGALGLWEKAKAHHLRALALREAIYARPHPKIAEALFYASLTDTPEGIVSKLHEAAEMLRQKAGGNNFPFILQALAKFRLLAGQPAAADSLSAEAIRYVDTHFLPGTDGYRYRSGQTAIHLANRAFAHTETGDTAQAAEWLAQADSLMRTVPTASAAAVIWPFVICQEGRLAMRRGDREYAENALASCVGREQPVPINSPFSDSTTVAPCKPGDYLCAAALADLVTLLDETGRSGRADRYRDDLARAVAIKDSLREIYAPIFAAADGP